ncbi:MAG TPA: AAA family ATPase, partial [Ktedonobacteraceae bacterium]|nr:AAA family ATPase [Ktedonobacteraceae bacterium]
MLFTLDERIIQELQRIRTELEELGKLPSAQQLAGYYATFRNKFGPEKLASLDGEVLLETLHGQGNREGLAYWLEFKDDDEFPAIFGSISGGSAYKFGLFRRQSTGVWTTGSSQKTVELSVNEAIEVARKHRDQLIAGANVLSEFSVSVNDEEYVQLQRDLRHVAPDIWDTAWGHKYFSLLYPEKLDDFHNTYYSRFHLIRLLQEPPEVEGRYTAAGRYIALARTLNLPVNTLTTLLNERNWSTPYNYWRIGTTAGDSGQTFWPDMRDGNFCAIGWSQLGDLTNITNEREGKEVLRALLKKYETDKHAIAIGKATQQIFDFRHHIEIGDLVLASHGAHVFGVGRVTGTYKYDASLGFPHLLPVEWLSLEKWDQPDQLPGIEGKLTTVYRMKRPRNLIEAERRILTKTVTPGSGPSNGEDKETVSVPPAHLTGILAKIQNILERKGQLILYGPPGTGKTYWAERAAAELAARASFQKSFDNLTAEQRASIRGENQTASGKVRMCCFHPAYGYEDFLEGF